MKALVLTIFSFVFMNSAAFAATPSTETKISVRCEFAQLPEVLQRIADLRIEEPGRTDLNGPIIKTIELSVEPDLIMFDDAPPELNLKHPFVSGDLSITVYSSNNTVSVDVFKAGAGVSHSILKILTARLKRVASPGSWEWEMVPAKSHTIVFD